MRHVVRLFGVISVIAFAAFAGSAQPAAAGVLTCNDSPERPFAAWGDNSPYTLAPNGSFEGGSNGWSLSGARVVDANNAYRAGSRALYLPSGSSATSPSTCVKLLDPSSRFFVRSTGSDEGRLKVELRYRTVLGLIPLTTTLGYADADGNWQPSPKFGHLLDNLLGTLALNSNASASVQFKFTRVGRGASFQIDDLFVDPLITI